MKKCFLLLPILSACGFEIVDTGYRGVKTTFGEVVGEPLPEGLHFYNPMTSDIKEYLVQQQTWTAKTEVFTKDTQKVSVEFAVTYYAEPKAVTKLYREYGSDLTSLETKVIGNIVLGSMKDAIGQVIADELVSKREAVTREAMRETKENLQEKNVIVTDMQFTNLDFDDAYEQAVEAKVVAVQKAAEAKNKTVEIEEQAKQKVMTAKADAESMRIKSQALAQNKGLVQFEAVQRWNGVLPVNIYGNAPIPFIGIDK